MGFFKHDQAIVETTSVGEGTRVWAFAHILPGAKVGSQCNICDHTFIENDVVIGNRVTIKCGVQLWDGIEVEDDVFIGPNATFTNDRFPRSGRHQASVLRTSIKRGASIGANATILPGLSIGHDAIIGAGTVVTRDVPPSTVVVGNPGKIIGYVGATGRKVEARKTLPPKAAGYTETGVTGVTFHRLPFVEDLRGFLSFGEAQKQIPFEIRRYFLVFGVPNQEIRGEHAHRSLHQFLICTHGSCRVVADDGSAREELLLDHPSLGVYLPPRTWAVQYAYSADAVLLVLASDRYDEADYIRNYDQFLSLVSNDSAERL